MLHPEKTIDYLVTWLRDYITSTPLRGFVVGMSGGIDSAVTMALCAHTGLPTLGVLLPIHQPPNHTSRAEAYLQELQQNFPKVSYTTVPLTDSFDIVSQTLISSDSETPTARDLALVNTRARLRMTTLYYVATTRNYLVAGTGNKIEDFGVGFFTKYGDGGVDISPIADLIKSEVYTLAEALGVSKAIRQAPPTDGLFEDDRSDEDQLGATYDELEWAMAAIEAGKSANDFEGRQREVLSIYLNLHQKNQHKMVPIPFPVIPQSLR